MNSQSKDIPVSSEELSILRAKLHSLQKLVKLFSKLGFFLPILGIILFILYKMEGHVFITIMLAGVFEWIALMEASQRFKKEFIELDKEHKYIDKKGVSDV